MLINGIELSEPEIRAKLKAMADEIVRLNEVIKRFDDENKELKRLLKQAVEDIGESECCWICIGHEVRNCAESRIYCTEWKHKAEALKLIGEDGDTNE